MESVWGFYEQGTLPMTMKCAGEHKPGLLAFALGFLGISDFSLAILIPGSLISKHSKSLN